MNGITQATYDAWRAAQGLPRRAVRQLDPQERDAIYRVQYWDKVHGDDLPAGLDYAVYDFAVNSGPVRAAKFLQRLVGAQEDGWIGVNTLAAVRAHGDTRALIIALCEARMAFLRRLRHWGTFKRGWTRRVMGRHDGSQQGDIGVIDRAAAMVRGGETVIPAPRVMDDGASAKADGPASVPGALGEAARDGRFWTVVGGIVSSALAAGSGSGPMAWAVSAVIVIGAVGALVWFLRGRQQ